MKDKIIVGKITNTHGLRGDIKIYPYTYQNNFENYKKIMIDGFKETYKLVGVKYHKNMVLAKLKGFNSINDVEKFKNREIYIYRQDLEELDEDEFYIADIIGCDIVDKDDNIIGVVKDYLTNMPQALIECVDIKNNQFFIPHVDEFIKEIDIENRKVIVELIEGLID